MKWVSHGSWWCQLVAPLRDRTAGKIYRNRYVAVVALNMRTKISNLQICVSRTWHFNDSGGGGGSLSEDRHPVPQEETYTRPRACALACVWSLDTNFRLRGRMSQSVQFRFCRSPWATKFTLAKRARQNPCAVTDCNDAREVKKRVLHTLSLPSVKLQPFNTRSVYLSSVLYFFVFV